MVTGLVVTSCITHATPATFSAHVVHRDLESEIAVHQIGDYPLGRQVDLMFGGGRCFFLPNSSADSCRTDDRNVSDDAINKFGFNFLSSRKEFDNLKLSRKEYVSLSHKYTHSVFIIIIIIITIIIGLLMTI